MFELPQNDATSRAAKLAGFDHAILLQEPVAAATAYGFQSDSDKAYWLVYDFGGGTFDASIVSVRDGQLSVVKHGGDNYLGGADFDRLLVDDCIVPHLQSSYALSDLDRTSNSEIAKGQLALLNLVAEEIKKGLSRADEESIYREELFVDDADTAVDLEITVTRARFEELIQSKVDASIDIVKQLIADAGLSAKDFEKVLLVGGSTLVPMVRSAVEQLGIPLALDLDPMTVVSYGAAVFASAQRLPDMLVEAVTVAGRRRDGGIGLRAGHQSPGSAGRWKSTR